uniref:TolB family protein n=1 Tax=uncultured Draconibacterium sp. TaxID=1573823 RepID=UPI0032165AB2
MKKILLPILLSFILLSCLKKPDSEIEKLDVQANIYPDYTNILVPYNIAPLNFKIEERGEAFIVRILEDNGKKNEFTSSDGVFKFPERKWRSILKRNKNKNISFEVLVKQENKWSQYATFQNKVSGEEVDPYLYYRILYPGYESWAEISIVQRSMESFDETPVIKNNVVGQNCVNCHAFNSKNPNNFLFHMRGSLGGTYFLNEGDLEKFNLKTKQMKNGAVYPRWHPSGNFVAFSSNKIMQQFHAANEKKIEVSDLNSTLVLYDVKKNSMMNIPVDINKEFMDTYPEWSPDGRYLYFCRAKQTVEGYDYRDIKYNLYRVSFNEGSRLFGVPELVYDAAKNGKSVSFPRISPDGSKLVFTYHDYGCFSIWHKEADLYTVDLNKLSVKKCELNSDFSESYHSWSSNSKWMVFSSKRGDGLTARPYISYINKNGNASKPFVLPQKDPEFYKAFIKTFNIPEFAQAEINFNPETIREAASKNAIQASWSK